MKKTTTILLLIFSTITGFGQSLFFDNINNSTWKADLHYNDSTIRTTSKIGLGKVNHSLDLLKIDVTIWTFKDSSLIIKYYDCHLKKDSLIAVYKYQVNADNGTLNITLNDNETLEYVAGIISTGSYAILTRKKKKLKK